MGDDDGLRTLAASPGGFRSGIALALLFGAGLILGLCLMEPKLLTRAWAVVANQAPASGRPAGVPGEDAWQEPPGTPEEAWFRVTIGKSAPDKVQPPAPADPAEPFELPEDWGPASGDPNADPSRSGDLGPAAVSSVLVEEGITLWRLAEQRYGADNGSELLEALARYNRLESPDQLETGQRVWFPPVDQLLGDR